MSEAQHSISFIELLENETKVQIPIIQRDYAQGRADNEEIIENFLGAIYHSINNGNNLELDFIYGSKEKNTFQPLDGQQRLTTLFLLHWFAALKDNRLDQFRTLLKKFSYETRITSREFCLALISADDIFLTEKKLSLTIINSKWFFLAWKNDQTIDAMLRAIDLIQKHFSNVINLSELLYDKKLIKFYNINLENIGLTDDLYIKMNARGKLLSPFENFKASFEKFIKENKYEDSLNPTELFSFKIDTKWTDFFWENFNLNNKIDSSIMKLISALTMYRLVLERKSQRISIIQNLHDNPNNLKPELITNESFQYVEKVFDFYSENFEKLSLTFNCPFFRHTPTDDFFTQIVDSNLSSSYSHKALFFAQTEYLLRNEVFDEDHFNNWMRVIRNIVSMGNIEKGGKRSDILRSPETFDGVINLINELAVGSNNIYNFLSNNERLNSTFARNQIEEERQKAKLIESRPELKYIIFKMEDLNLFKGRINFAFQCIDYDNNTLNFNHTEFEQVQNIIEANFNNEEADISNDIRRALLTIEINNKYFYEYWWSYWFVTDSTKRCLIENFNEIEYIIYSTEESKFIKELVNLLKKKTLDEVLNEFTPTNSTPNWKIRLIKEKNLLNDHCKSKYIAIDDNKNICYLLRSKRPRDIVGCYEVN